MITRRAVLLALLAAFLSVTARAKVTVNDAQLGFSFDLPVGFAATDQAAAPPGVDPADVLHRYSRGVGRLPATTVLVIRVHGATPSSTAPAANNSADDAPTETWKSFTLPVDRTTDSVDGSSRITFSVRVPLTPDPIQISVSGPPNQEKRNRALVKQILASLTGPTTGDISAPAAAPNSASPGSASARPTPQSAQPPGRRKLTSEERGERMGYGIMAVLICIGVVAALLLHKFRQKVLTDLGTKPGVNPFEHLTPAKARMIGVASVGGSALAYYWCVLQPLADAADHKPSLSLTHMGVIMTPVLLCTGLFLLVNGNRAWTGYGKSAKIVGTAAYAIFLAAGFALDIWFRSRLSAMGYSVW